MLQRIVSAESVELQPEDVHAKLCEFEHILCHNRHVISTMYRMNLAEKEQMWALIKLVGEVKSVLKKYE